LCRERELEVRTEVARGRSNAEIAREMYLSEATVNQNGEVSRGTSYVWCSRMRGPSTPAAPAGHDAEQGGVADEASGSERIVSGRREGAPAGLAGLPGRAIDRLESERLCWAVLASAIVLSAGVGLWLTRGATFYWDELMWLVANRGAHLSTLLGPHNGNLIAGTRVIYAVVLKLFGANYLVFRLLEVFGVGLVAALFFAFAKRRVEPRIALVPSLLLLFLGSSYEVTLLPLGIEVLCSVAAGLLALFALDKRTRGGDLLACALVTVSVATFSVGLAFIAGVAVSVLLRADRWRRAWIFLVPLLLYGAWLVAARHIHGPEFSAATRFGLSNVLSVPNYMAAAAAAVAAALTGLGHDFVNPSAQGSLVNSTLGWPLALLAAAALILRLRRGNVPASLWTSLTILLAFWISSAVVSGPPDRLPNSGRYMYPAAVAVLLISADAIRAVRFSRGGVLALFALGAFSLAGNLAQLRSGGISDRSYSAVVRAQVGALQLTRGGVDPAYLPTCTPALPVSCALSEIGQAGHAGALLSAVHRYGSFGFSSAELRGQSEPVRELADSTLAGALRIGLVPAGRPAAATRCLHIPRTVGPPLRLSLRPPGLVLRTSDPTPVLLGRYGTTSTVNVGNLEPGAFATLAIPADREAQPWHAVVALARGITACPLGQSTP
jgi:Bacterial regulatory proteins, luxR family